MGDQHDDVVRTMLTLAGISYRGTNLILPEQLKRPRLRALMDECMARFSTVKDKWKIVWGPASFSAVSPGLDDALIYVAQSIASPSTIAIAIRGTNPMSLSDWVFGDLMVTHQVPWTYGDSAVTSGPMISASTAIGLGILQHLRWNDSGPTASPAPAVASRSLAGTVKPDSLEGWAEMVRARLSSQAGAAVVETLEARLKDLKSADFNPLTLLRRNAASSNAINEGSLKDFLRTHIATHAKLDIHVTGHSKGGALSSTLALWLADTQGPQNHPAEEWDRDRTATIHCCSFAGPTAGNDAFARHSDQVLGGDCHRIWNEKDVVPRAFVADELATISALYGLDGIEKKTVDGLTKAVADAVRALNYRQICGPGTRLDCELLPALPFPLQIIRQHLDSYLDKFGLLNEMSTATLLAPAL